jgi:hypothetical protein
MSSALTVTTHRGKKLQTVQTAMSVKTMACRHIPLSHPTQSPRSINLSISRAIHLPTSPICVCRASASYKIVEPDFSPPICPVKTPNFLMVQRSVPTLLDLPIEIYLQIIGFLDYPSCLALSQTDSFFRALVTVDKPTTSEQKLLYLCTAENWSRYELSFIRPECRHYVYSNRLIP